jgi:hypothetical protein
MKRLIPIVIVILLITIVYCFDYLSSKNSQPIQFDDLIHVLATESEVGNYLDSIGFVYHDYSHIYGHSWSYNYDPNTELATIWFFDESNEENFFIDTYFVFAYKSAYNFLVKDIQEKCQYVHDVDYMKVYYHYLTNILFYCGYDSEYDVYMVNLTTAN